MKRHVPKTIWPTTWVDWLVIAIILMPLWAAFLLPALIRLPVIDPATR